MKSRERSEQPSAGPSLPGAAPIPLAVEGALLDYARLLELARSRASEFRSARPFPHVVIDDFLPREAVEAVVSALPAPGDPNVKWGNVNTDLPDGRPAQKLKHHVQHVLYMRPPLRQLFAELNGGAFLFILRHLTGIPGLISDPQLQGGGVHFVEPGGLLRVHADFNKHPAYGLDRRLNLLLYLNPRWEETWGGHLELWDAQMTKCERNVLPTLNRCVVFETSSTSFHGHPQPLACPQGVVRCSAALYYYSMGGPARTTQHGTLWQDLPSEKQGTED